MKSSILFWFSLFLQEHLIILVQYMWLGDMAGLISKIDRSSMGPLPACYYSTLKSLIKSMLRENPEHRPSCLFTRETKLHCTTHHADKSFVESQSRNSSSSDKDSLTASEKSMTELIVNCDFEASDTDMASTDDGMDYGPIGQTLASYTLT
ncbi:serine/threonine-protein kinase Nek5-like [Macadamia integrifolia]|uniref:serine/threonine-protein kinase Nek5-like n=1 Tax=Macadamia integrifolia TaxID=60698 RepID=UPI001C4F1A6D|nr:serine/threonine-protein kinase Nek5-like [Macadamia integrifolia]